MTINILSSVGIEMVYGLLHSLQTGSGIHSASYPTGIRGSFSGGEADHVPPSNAEVKNSGAIPTLPHIFLWHSA
jgi:hypothetical protein